MSRDAREFLEEIAIDVAICSKTQATLEEVQAEIKALTDDELYTFVTE